MVTRLVIVGDGEFAEIAYEYFTHDSPYEVVGFAVEEEFRQRDEFYDRPVVPFEEIDQHFSPADVHVFVAVTYTQLNRVRGRLYRSARERGYTCASYVSSRAFVWHNVTLGQNCFVFEGNVLQHHVRVGDNVVLWSGNHVGHRSVIGEDCFLSSHVVVSGYCEIGPRSFLGVNATLADNVTIGEDCVIGAGSVIASDTQPREVYKPERAKASRIDSHRLFKLGRAA